MRGIGYFLAGALLLASTAASASDGSAGYIMTPMPMRNGVVLFTHSGARIGTMPACQTTNWWALSARTVEGQAALSVLMTAYAMHKRIVIVGTGNCADWMDTEGVNYFRVEE